MARKKASQPKAAQATSPPKNVTSSRKRTAKKVESEDPDEPKEKQKKDKGDVGQAADSEQKEVKTVVIKGQAAVDVESGLAGQAHVYCEGGDIYDAMLNQADVMNNNNKYYILQLLKDDNKMDYYVWFRWGRVGKKGQNSLVRCSSNLESAKSTFTKKFYEKTKNQWVDRENFVKVKGKYDLLQMDYNTEDVEKKEKVPKKKTKEKIKSCLDDKLQDLIQLIFDVKEMEAVVVEMQYDAKKAPLGKLTKEQIKAGYLALKKIEECISKEDFGNPLVEACNEFYTRIPHDFGMKRPPIIRTLEVVHAKVEMLEALGDIEIAMKLLSEELENEESPVDRHYKSLNCNLKVMDKDNSDFQMIEEYLENTHGDTHRSYKLELMHLFEVDRGIEKKDFKDVGNRMLLWHGSRLTNFAGILKQGLRIAPPEAPVTGYMFDKGIYFADTSSKSANYCYPKIKGKKGRGLMLLCEVSLGKQNKLISSNYNASKLPKGHHSVMGLGQKAPNSKEQKALSDGIVVPMGKVTDAGVKNNYSLLYNEYIVYDPKQVRIRYLLDLNFKYC